MECILAANLLCCTAELLARSGIGDQQLEISDVAIVTVERGEGVRSLLEHLLGHRDRVAELLEIQRGDTFRSRQGHDLIIYQSEEVFDGLELAFHELHGTLDVVESGDTAFED